MAENRAWPTGPIEEAQNVPYVLLLGYGVRVVCIVKDRKVYDHLIRRSVIMMIL
jgi:hypothetical protein